MQKSQNVQPNQLIEHIARAFQFYNGNDTVLLYVREDKVNSRIESLGETGIQVLPLPIRQRPTPFPNTALKRLAPQRLDGLILHAAFLIQALRRKQLVKRSRDQLHMDTSSGRAISSLQNFCASYRERKPLRREYLQFVIVMVTDGLRLYLLLDMASTTFQALLELAEKLPTSETRKLEFDDCNGQIYSEYWFLFEDPKVFDLDATKLQEKLKEGEKITHALNGKLSRFKERLQAEFKELEDAKAISMKNSGKGKLGPGAKGKENHDRKMVLKTEGSNKTKKDKSGREGEIIAAKKEEKSDEGAGETKESKSVGDVMTEGTSGMTKKDERKVENLEGVRERGKNNEGGKERKEFEDVRETQEEGNSEAKKEGKTVESVKGVGEEMEERKNAEVGKEGESVRAIIEEQTGMGKGEGKGKGKETAVKGPESKENPGDALSGSTGKKEETKGQNSKGGGSKEVSWIPSGGGKIVSDQAEKRAERSKL